MKKILLLIPLLFISANLLGMPQMKAPHDSDGASGIINGKLLKDGKTPLADHPVVLEIISGDQMVLSIPKKTDKNGGYQFKNIFKTGEFAYVISAEVDGRLFKTDFISLKKNESVKTVNLNVGEGFEEESAIQFPSAQKMEMKYAKKRFSEYQIFAVIMSLIAIAFAIYQRRYKK